MSSEPPCASRKDVPASPSLELPSDRQLLTTFVRRRGEAAEWAFEVLVRRHGPMVLRVCARALEEARDVEDAFRATFLVLACRAQAIGASESPGGWLLRVARRVAGRRRAERFATAGGGPFAVEGWDDLHREIDRLPERDRAAIVLCDLGGLAVEEAAGRLGWPVDRVRGRLSRARERLRSRLARRGLDPPATFGSPPLPLPASLADSALAIVRGTTAIVPAVVVAPSAEVASLAHPVLRSLAVARLRATACTMLAAGIVLLGAGLGVRHVLVDRPALAVRPSADGAKAGNCPDAGCEPGRPGPAEAPVVRGSSPPPLGDGSVAD